MDSHLAGPHLSTVLTRQAEHRSSLLWNGPSEGEASKKKVKQIGSAPLLVQLWAYAKFPHICPVMRHPHQALPPSPLAVRWKGAKFTIEHATHVLHAYHMSLALLRLNQVVKHASHIAKWVVHATIVDAPLFDGELRYNDEYMKWFHPHTRLFITKETLYWDTLVKSHLKILAKCKSSFEIHTDCVSALKAIKELSQLTLDNACIMSNRNELTVGHDERRRCGGHQSSRCHTPVHDHTMEEASQ
ncbi:hypothetical protein CFP56_017083 [Quercus suber]|uniref:Uncharacterized protein n=1 Tax=Quercus suber TaxID=58331 RepID=A0AAW0M1L4_QUESU